MTCTSHFLLCSSTTLSTSNVRNAQSNLLRLGNFALVDKRTKKISYLAFLNSNTSLMIGKTLSVNNWNLTHKTVAHSLVPVRLDCPLVF